MIEKFIKISKAILEETKKYNPLTKDIIEIRLKYLFIDTVEYTGVGYYINFSKNIQLIKSYDGEGYIGADNNLIIIFDTLDVEFDFIVSYSRGYIDMIEIVTSESIDWSGEFNSFLIRERI